MSKKTINSRVVLIGEGKETIKVSIFTYGDPNNVTQQLSSGDFLDLMRQNPEVIALTLGDASIISSIFDINKSSDNINEFLTEEIFKSTFSSLSASRQKFVSILYDKVKNYTSGQQNTGMIICLEGPPGMGKTTLLKEVAIQLGCKVFTPRGISSKFVGTTSKTIHDIFTYSRENAGLILWDEIDAIAAARSDRSTDVANDRLDVVRALIDELDKPGTILLCTTNFKNAIDPALVSRFQENTYSLPNITLEDRIKYIGATATQLTHEEQSDISIASFNLSFREIHNICENLPKEFSSKILPRIIYSWRKAIVQKNGQNSNLIWSLPTESDIKGSDRIWAITSDSISPSVVVSHKKPHAYSIGEIGINGFTRLLAMRPQSNDVNSAILDRKNNQVLLAGDDGVGISRDSGNQNFSIKVKNEYVYDAIWVPGCTDQFLSVTKNGFLSHHYFHDGQIILGPQIKLDSGRSLKCISASDSKIRLAMAGERTSFRIIDYDLDNKKFELFTEIDFSGMNDSFYDYRRIGTFFTENSVFIACGLPDGVGVWLLGEKGLEKPKAVARFKVDNENETCFAIDQTNGLIAIATKNKISIYNSFNDSALVPKVLVVPEGKTITAICFTLFGQALVIGTKEGFIYSSMLRPHI